MPRFSRTLLVRTICSGLVSVGLGAVGAGAQASVWVELTDAIQRDLPGKVELYQQGKTVPLALRVPEGKGLHNCPPGQYKALVYVYDWDVPVMVDIQEVVVEAGKTVNILFELIEGRSGNRPLRAFDTDGDLVLDRVEIAAGTDPQDPASFPGAVPLNWTSPVLDAKGDWYAGDLHVRSQYGGGELSVAAIVQQAESLGLDFVAIADRNTFQAASDPAFKSNKVVLIPAMEWGDEERGVALIYGPRTMPMPTDSVSDVQGICNRVQAQGGLFAVAHPCFPQSKAGGNGTAPWQWGTSFVNAIEVWCRSWRDVPPVSLDAFDMEYQRRRQNKLIYSISRAASASTLSANGQATMFWDFELTRGLKASPIAGSLSSSAKVPMGQPVTYVFAREKSAAGILEGMRLGRTFVTSSKKGPIIRFTADEGGDGFTDVNMGGIVPLNRDVRFAVQVIGAKGASLELLRNGRVIHSHRIDHDRVEAFLRTEHPTSYSVYRARVTATPTRMGFGPHDVLAMSSPIYAQEIVAINAGLRLQLAEMLSTKAYTLDGLVEALNEDETKLFYHLQQLDNLGLLLAKNEGSDRFFRIDSAAYQYMDKSLLTVDDVWAPVSTDDAPKVQATTTLDPEGHVWVRPRGPRVASPLDVPDWELPAGAKVIELDAKPLIPGAATRP